VVWRPSYPPQILSPFGLAAGVATHASPERKSKPPLSGCCQPGGRNICSPPRKRRGNRPAVASPEGEISE